MGLLDELKGALGEAEAAGLPALVNSVLAKTQYHDLAELVAALEKGGLGPQVQSWLGNGANLPITADQLREVLGNSQVQDFARHLGLPVDETSQNAGAISAAGRRQGQPERHTGGFEVMCCFALSSGN